MSDSRPTITIRDLIACLIALPANKSVLIVGNHGVGKSEIAAGIAEHFKLKHIDRRLAQMSEGDMIGLPIVSGETTAFLPVDWFMEGVRSAVSILLDEINRAGPEVMNAAFQLVLDRELNGKKLHPGTRVIACINAGAHYSVNDMDPALVNRFAVFHLDPDVEDWKNWARSPRGDIDPVLVDYIHHNPGELRFKDVGQMESLTAYPTPRGWASVDKCLKHANMAPSDVSGQKTPDVFFQLVASIVGHPAAVGFTKFVKEYTRIVTAEDVLDNWSTRENDIKALGHDGIVAVLEKIGNHCGSKTWTPAQVQNLVNFGKTCLSGEDHVLLFSKVTTSKNAGNIMLYHQSPLTQIVIDAVNTAEEITKRKS